MSYQAFFGLVGNASLLLAMGLIYDFVSEKKIIKGKKEPIATGFMIGLLGMVVMMNPWRFSTEVVFDTRSILLSLCGLFFGFLPSVIAVLITALYRIYAGGGGVYAGVATVITSVFIGLFWRKLRSKPLLSMGLTELYLFGVAVHINMLLCMLLLPAEARTVFYTHISLPVMIIYPFASMLLGKVLVEQMKRSDSKRKVFEEKELLSVTLKSIGDAVIATDIDGKVVLLNMVAEKLSGWKIEDAKGRRLEEVFHIVNETTGEKCANPVEMVLKTSEIVELANHTMLISRSGSRHIIEDCAAPIKNEEGCTIGVVLVFRDMTEKNKLTDKLRNVEKLESLGVLAGGIAHDFNNLLAGIYGNIELATEKNDPQEMKKNLKKAMDVSERAKDLTRQLLTFSRGGSPVLQPGNISKVIKESSKFALSGSKCFLEFDLEDNLWNCMFDKNQMGDVLHNIIINAAQASPEDSCKIVVSAKNINLDERSFTALSGKYVKISVKDNGAGIPADKINKIFDPFFTTKKNGTGLGLPTCFSIMEKHNGLIELESTSSSGTIFSIYLPAVDQELVINDEYVAQNGYIEGNGKKILVMDDESYIREVFASMISGLGFTVEKAEDGKEAIEKIKYANDNNERYHAAFFDLTVQGGMGGRNAVQNIRTFDTTTPIFASSGYSDDEVMVSPEKFGFTDSIKKPFNLKDLSDVLKKIEKT